MADAATWKKHVAAWRASDAKSVYDLLFKPAAERPPLDDGEPDLDGRHEVGCWSHCRRKAWEVAITSKDPVAREAVLRIKRTPPRRNDIAQKGRRVEQ